MTTTSPPGVETPAVTPPAGIRKVLTALMMAMFVAILAATVVANALPTIVADLDGSQSVYTWIVTTELLAMTATVPIWGKLADLYDKKLLLQLSLGLFVFGSLVAGLTPNVEVLIASRVLQGVGAGGLSALVLIVLAVLIPPRELGKYSGLFGAVFGVATVAGPLIGGVLVDTSWLGWRWCFLIGVPFAGAAIVLLQRTLHLPRSRGRGAAVDWKGATLVTTGVSVLLVWTSLAGNRFEWMSGWSALMVGGGVLLLVLFVLVERRAPEPVIPLGLFSSRTVTLATVTSLLVGAAMFGSTVFLSQYFQIALGKSPTVAGLLSLPMVFGLLVSSTVSGQLITRWGRWKVWLVAGSALMLVGMLLLGTLNERTGMVRIGVFMAVLGVGVGMLMQNLVLAAQNDVPAKDLGAATSTLTFFRSMGGAIGVSVLGAVLAHKVTGGLTDRLGPAAGSGGGAENAVPDVSTLPPEVLTIVQQVYAGATAELFLIGAPLTVLALLAVLFIREKPLQTLSGEQRLANESATAAH